MKVGFKLFVALCIFSFQLHAQEPTDNPYVLVENVASNTFSRMQEEKISADSDTQLLRNIIREEMIPYIDYQFAAFKVLGKNFRDVSKQELFDYVDLFREYLIANYAIVLSYYDAQIVEFEPVSNFANKEFIAVRALLKRQQGSDISLAFKLRKSRQGNEWKAYDLVAEGVSLVDSKRSEFQAIIRNQGIDGVMATMQASINSPEEVADNKLSSALD